MRNTNFLSILLVIAVYSFATAQDNSALFKNGGAYINSVNGSGYFSPLVKVMNNSVHASLFPASDLRDSFYFYIGINTNVAFIPDRQRHFEGSTSAPFAPLTSVDVPTVFGENEFTILEDQEGWAYIFPGGLEMKRFYLAMPQVTIGGIAHTSLTMRFIGFSLNEDIGKLQLFGLGLQHDLSRFIPLDRFKVTGEFAFHQFKTGNWMKSNHLMIRSSIIQQFRKAKCYGFLGFQHGSMSLFDIEEDITTKIKGANNLLIGAGASADLAFINIGLEASYSSVFTTNVSFGFKF